MDQEEKKYWLAFNSFFLFGPKKFNLLLSYFKSARIAWQAKEKQLYLLNLGQKTIEKFLSFRKNFNLEKYLEDLEKEKIKVVTLLDKDYPSLLKEIADPPFLFYLKTNLTIKDCFSSPCLAIVGSRKITSYGRVVTQKLTTDLVKKGFTIVSGLARGVDVCAHQTTLNNKGKTLAVLGSGLNYIYPRQHLRISREIINQGALISEFPLDQTPKPGNFPIRNRIISGLSLGIVVTQAAKRSGTSIIASCAGDQGREVFAVPGPITSIYSEGTSQLLKKGAKLVTQVSDIIEELPFVS